MEVYVDDRPGWTEYFLGIAQAVAARGDCRRSRVGCVVVTPDQRVLGVGYNGTAERGVPGCLQGHCPRGRLDYGALPAYSDYSNCRAVHAESNAIRWTLATVGRNALIGTTLYTTRAPCQPCKLEARSVGVREIIHPMGFTLLDGGVE